MAFSSLRRRTRATGGKGPQPVGSPDRVNETPAGPSSYVSAESELSGTLQSKGTVRIDGRVKGEIRSDQTVIVSGSARVEASIEAESVLISGEVKGNIAAKHKITLGKTARVTGDLSTPGIVIEEGAKLKGRITIGSEGESEAEAPTSVSPPEEQRDKPSPARAATSRQPAAPAPQI